MVAVAVAVVVAGVGLLSSARAAVAAPAGPPTATAAPSPPPPASGPVPPIVVDPTDPGQPDPGPAGGAGVPEQDPSRQDDPGFFDVAGRVKKAINDWFRDLVNAALHPVLAVLGHTLLATPDVAGQDRVRQIWGNSAAVANTVFVLFVVVGGVVVMSHETLQTRYTLKDVLPRLVVGFVAANASLSLIHQGVVFANALARALLGQQVTPDVVETLLTGLILRQVDTGGIFTILLCLVAAVLALVLLVTYLVRVTLVILLTTAAPLALVCHALPQTEGAARLWWRALVGCFAVQVGQALVLITALKVLFDGGHGGIGLGLATGWLVDLLMVLVLFYVLLRIPVWFSRQVFAGQRRSTLVSLAKYAAIHRGLSLLRGHPTPPTAARTSHGVASRTGVGAHRNTGTSRTAVVPAGVAFAGPGRRPAGTGSSGSPARHPTSAGNARPQRAATGQPPAGRGSSGAGRPRARFGPRMAAPTPVTRPGTHPPQPGTPQAPARPQPPTPSPPRMAIPPAATPRTSPRRATPPAATPSRTPPTPTTRTRKEGERRRDR